MAQWSTLMPCNREAAGSNLSGVLAFFLKGAHYENDYSGKKTYLAGLQCTLTSSCAKNSIYCFSRISSLSRNIILFIISYFLEIFTGSADKHQQF